MTSTAIQRRELAQRANHGIEITLFWSESSNRVTIEIADTRLDEVVELEVAGADALDAFYHPYAYAFARRPGAHVKAVAA